ncbi:MFS general substrate transporter [Mytilinidion resinicola]|uniref:MFS general substrate transporter n=1 Tax=Mytilinidion resinicola TaxID=574789 RepID=A0A6A6YUB1_9PEZI|nr:MFS general substrate transporter [Mytilinidion resinicola]KAF2812109.1 MFS general substrate transporter [Mytilinidion resinicola]
MASSVPRPALPAANAASSSDAASSAVPPAPAPNPMASSPAPATSPFTGVAVPFGPAALPAVNNASASNAASATVPVAPDPNPMATPTAAAAPVLPVSSPPVVAVSYTALSLVRRQLICTIVVFATIASALPSDMLLPILPVLEQSLFVSGERINGIVAAGLAVAVATPLIRNDSDYFGRQWRYLFWLVLHICTSTSLSILPNLPDLTYAYHAFFVGRVVQVLSASAIQTIGGGIIADISPQDELTLGTLAVVIRAIVGPLLGGFVTKYGQGESGIFVTSCTTVIVLYIAAFLCVPETLRPIVGDGTLYAPKLLLPVPLFHHTVADPHLYPPHDPHQPLRDLRAGLSRRKLAAIAANALLFATYYAINVTLCRTLTARYRFNSFQIGAAYTAKGVAMLAGWYCSSLAAAWDRGRAMRQNPGRPPAPEYRLWTQALGAVVFCFGALGYAGFVWMRWHVAGVVVFVAVAAFGVIWSNYQTKKYLGSFAPFGRALGSLSDLVGTVVAAVMVAVAQPLIDRVNFLWFFMGLVVLQLVCLGVVRVTT